MYLHFKCYYLSWFLLLKPLSHSLASMRLFPQPPTPTTLPWHSLTLGNQPFTGPRAFPPIDARQCHPLLHMCLELWMPLCVLFNWWFSPWELWRIWLVDIVVLPMGLQTPSASSVLSQLLHCGPNAQFNGWLKASTSVLVRLWHSLSGDNHTRLLSVSTSGH